MSIDGFYRYTRQLLGLDYAVQRPQFKEIPKCLVRRDHYCGKFLGASKSCFVASPSTDEVETMLALIIEKLVKIGIEPIIAVKERAYGQDIFCTKICGKIIESQFCIVILDDMMQPMNGTKVNIPNPNVYYEYGLMTALNKHVIPLQKEGQKLAFNIQTHDTIKYTPHNLSAELDRALKDAIKMTQEDRSGYQDASAMSERLFSRCLEISGYQKKDHRWFLSSEFEDTVFTGYGHPERREYLFFTVIDDKELLRSTLTDMQVIIKRLESSHKQLSEKRDTLSNRIDKLNREVQGAIDIAVFGSPPRRSYELEKETEEREETSSRIQLIENGKFAIVLGPQVTGLKEKAISEHKAMDNRVLSIPLYIGDTTGIRIGDLDIAFKAPTL
jgi:hypothetical protein